MTRAVVRTRRQVKYDGSDTSTHYMGETNFGTLTSSPTWRIFRIIYNGASFDITWADGDDEFDNVWDDRASLSYS